VTLVKAAAPQGHLPVDDRHRLRGRPLGLSVLGPFRANVGYPIENLWNFRRHEVVTGSCCRTGRQLADQRSRG